MRLLLIAAAAATTAALAAEAPLPPEGTGEARGGDMSEDAGGTEAIGPLALVGCGTRSILWKKLYGLSLYDGQQDAEMIVMTVLHDGELPSGLPDDWPPKLRRTVDEGTIAEIDEAFGLIRPDSRVEIAFDPEADRSRMVVDGRTAVDVPARTTYDAIRAMWFGEDPIDAKLKRTILAGRCDQA